MQLDSLEEQEDCCGEDHDHHHHHHDDGTYYRNTPKIGRNEPCYCGSGKKYKKCCLANA